MAGKKDPTWGHFCWENITFFGHFFPPKNPLTGISESVGGQKKCPQALGIDDK